MREKVSRRKKAVNVTIVAELAADTKAFFTNMSAALEKALQAELKEPR